VQPSIYQAQNYQIEPDASTSSYFFALAALTGGSVTVANLSRKNSLQGDVKFLEVLEIMGCQVSEDNKGITVVGPEKLTAADIDMSGFSDTFMTIAVLAVFADKPMTLTSLSHTRLQESDRVSAIAIGLANLGIKTTTTKDSIKILPGVPKAGTVSSFNDHRIAMSLALIGVKVKGVVIDGAESVAKTCPEYFELLDEACQL
jgi:3-phosphoshikimate 1-carboxyvinyltransferase